MMYCLRHHGCTRFKLELAFVFAERSHCIARTHTDTHTHTSDCSTWSTKWSVILKPQGDYFSYIQQCEKKNVLDMLPRKLDEASTRKSAKAHDCTVFCASWPWPLTFCPFDPKINGFPGSYGGQCLVIHSCIGFRDIIQASSKDIPVQLSTPLSLTIECAIGLIVWGALQMQLLLFTVTGKTNR